MNAMDPRSPIENGVVLTPAQQKARRQRNIAIGLAVALLCALFYAVTIAKLGSGVIKGAG
ncbi:MAG: hypothetical protein KDJ23_16085 [Rhodoblastus sp.]|nr:hypothetical protein [Rhodoblastus sp.]MCB9999965.1 hypothetical protein [Methylobacteriaceae bacterium]MCC0001659.1 hypothetical protein [Methylobacteriaceae bacterium]MCC2100795.1 hypothetical protein [Hyphomicrobiales bacterium]HPG03724.1 hypothetical protein [Rhodoblastus sp.]